MAARIKSLIEEVQQGQLTSAYTWLPVGCLPALGHIALAALYRPNGKMQPALSHLNAAQALLEAALDANHIDMEVGFETN